MPGSILGTSVRRLEDPDLLTGRGTFVGNLALDGLAWAAFVRSPYPHARIVSIDLEEARSAPGVAGLFVAADLDIQPFHGFMVLNPACARPPLAVEKVRFVGEAVAMVVADSPAAAADAAELVLVEYDPLEAVVDMEEALGDGAPLQFETIGSNLVAGSKAPPGPDPLEGAAHVVRAQLDNQRVAVMPMEGDAIVAVPGAPGDGRYEITVHLSTQMPHGAAGSIARIFSMDRERIRVIAPHVGGAFGGKAGVGAEHAAVIQAARRLGRPVGWVQSRSENLVSMPHGRGQRQWIEMGFDDDLRFTGMRCRVVGDAGAYAGFGGALAIGPTKMMSQGVYAIPRIDYDVAVAVTNTTPMGAFRGAGRPEAAEYLERMMDIAAGQLEVDPAELRRRNLLPAFSEPFGTVMGTTYDNGDYPRVLDEALRRAGYEELRAEQAARRATGDGRLLGIGMSVYVEITAGGGSEFGSVEVNTDGSATIRVGTSAHGQGHATAFSMLVSEQLGIPMDRVRFVQSDTAEVPRGGGTGGSRSLQIGGNAVLGAARLLLERAKEIAATELEASVEDIVVHEGRGLGVAGVPANTLGWADLARLATERYGEERLAAEFDFAQKGATFPFGAHASVVEVDAETGKVYPLRHIAVDDCGRVLNPLLVTGQQHGGIGQGMSQALFEEMVYDAAGNPVTASLADYAMPSAAELPSFETFNTETPTPLNPIGAKGIGESGTIGSTPAVHNAVVDALAHLGVRHVDMPCTPERVWRAIKAALEGGENAAGGGRPLWRPPPAVFERLPVAGAEADPEAAGADI
jgi:carbon-monoxide dehydrogenase large subunit